MRYSDRLICEVYMCTAIDKSDAGRASSLSTQKVEKLMCTLKDDNILCNRTPKTARRPPNSDMSMHPTLYSLAPFFFRRWASLSLRSRRRILPLGLLGMASINSTPPLSHLCRAL